MENTLKQKWSWDHLLPQNRWWDWPAIALLFVLTQTVASRLIVTNWTQFLYFVQVLAFWGTLLGLALGYSNFRKAATRWITLGYTLIVLPLRFTHIIDEKVAFDEKLVSAGGRLLFSFHEFFLRKPVEDPIFFVFIVSLTYWLLSISAGYSLARHQNYLKTILPSAVGILVIQSYDNYMPIRLSLIGFFAFISLLLLGRLYYLENKQSWKKRRVFTSSENGIDLAGGMVLAAALIIFVAWSAPASISSFKTAAVRWQKITKPWRDFNKRMENAVSALESPSGGKPGEFYGGQLPLGQGFPLSDVAMFSVHVPTLPIDAIPPRYYWRGRIYDQYKNGQWQSTITTHQPFSPNEDEPLVDNPSNAPIGRFIFTTGQTTFGLIYAPSQPVWVSRPGEIYSTLPNNEADIIAWFANPVLAPGEQYQVDAIINNPNIEQLRASGTDYPDWVKQKYLQLPENFSPRIRELASTLAQGSDTPYDKTMAITRYLRENIEYAPTIPQAPRNRDPLEWMLFDYKKGFCVYYATSEVVMLRSLGIPARMAVGFAQGEQQITSPRGAAQFEEEATRITYNVSKNNAHAWPEVYFPGVGWVEFEPTAGQDPLIRPNALSLSSSNANNRPQNLLQDENNPVSGKPRVDEEGVTPATPAPAINPLLYLIPLLMAFAALTVFLNGRYQLARQLPTFVRSTIERNGSEAPGWIVHWERWVALSPIEKAFESINRNLRMLDEQPPVHATPAERADKLSKLMPDAASHIKVLLDEHQASFYTSRVGDAGRARRAAWSITIRALRVRASQILNRFERRFTG